MDDTPTPAILLIAFFIQRSSFSLRSTLRIHPCSGRDSSPSRPPPLGFLFVVSVAGKRQVALPPSPAEIVFWEGRPAGPSVVSVGRSSPIRFGPPCAPSFVPFVPFVLSVLFVVFPLRVYSRHSRHYRLTETSFVECGDTQGMAISYGLTIPGNSR